MIYVQRHYVIMNNKGASSCSILNMDLAEGLEYAEEVLSDLTPMVYLKETGSDSLIELELIDNQVIISYILDLFKFEGLFKDL